MSLKVTIMGDTAAPPDGFDSAILLVPDAAYVTAGAVRTLHALVLRGALSRATAQSCAAVGERLHHAEWTVTSAPGEVRTLGLMHDCPTCRAAVDQALAHLREHPEAEIAVGQLWWAAVPRPD